MLEKLEKRNSMSSQSIEKSESTIIMTQVVSQDPVATDGPQCTEGGTQIITYVPKRDFNPKKRTYQHDIEEQSTPSKKAKTEIFEPITNRTTPPSPIKVTKQQSVLLTTPKDTIKHGVGRKLFTDVGMIKEVRSGICLANEIIFSKFLRGWFLEKENTKELSPRNELVETPSHIHLMSTTISGFNTLHSLESPLRLQTNARLWEQFLQHYSAFYMLLRNPDLHPRNLGYKMVGDKECIAAVDFEQVFLIASPINPKASLFEFLHVLHHWHKIETLTSADIKVIYTALMETHTDIDRLKSLFREVIEVAIRDCNETMADKFPDYKVVFTYTPNNDVQSNPLVPCKDRKHLTRFETFRHYSESLLLDFNTSAAHIPFFLTELENYLDTGIDIKPFLLDNGIDIDHFKKLEAVRKAAAEAKTTTL